MRRDEFHGRVWCFCILILVCLLPCFSVSAQEAKEKEKKVNHTSTFMQEWLKTLVSIEVWEPNEPKEPEKEPSPIGSGFLVKIPNGRCVLVTARHVAFTLNPKKKTWEQKQNLAYRLNKKEGESELVRERFVAQYRGSGWFKSEKHDVACRLMIVRTGISDVNTIPYSMFIKTAEIQAGAPLLVVGFPLGFRSEEYAVPIVRRGMVARTDADIILADAFTFPGNSGGPVIYAPATPLGKVFSTSILQDQRLVGLVSGHISYTDVAVSRQTKRPRVTFEENSGLCKVVPASAIRELLESPEFKAALEHAKMLDEMRDRVREGNQPAGARSGNR